MGNKGQFWGFVFEAVEGRKAEIKVTGYVEGRILLTQELIILCWF